MACEKIKTSFCVYILMSFILSSFASTAYAHTWTRVEKGKSSAGVVCKQAMSRMTKTGGYVVAGLISPIVGIPFELSRWGAVLFLKLSSKVFPGFRRVSEFLEISRWRRFDSIFVVGGSLGVVMSLPVYPSEDGLNRSLLPHVFYLAPRDFLLREDSNAAQVEVGVRGIDLFEGQSIEDLSPAEFKSLLEHIDDITTRSHENRVGGLP